MKQIVKLIAAFSAVLALAVLPTATVLGQANSDVTQEINGGTLSTAILDAGRTAVPSPSFAMSAQAFSFNCTTSTGTLGSSTQRLYVINPSGTTSGQSWTLTLAATGPWTSGGNNYAYNQAAGSGCTSGQLTVNANAGTVTTDCVSSACTGATVSKGSSTAMTGSTPVTILSTSAGVTVWRGYITGVALSQAIPPETPAGAYVLPVTLTVTAA